MQKNQKVRPQQDSNLDFYFSNMVLFQLSYNNGVLYTRLQKLESGARVLKEKRYGYPQIPSHHQIAGRAYMLLAVSYCCSLVRTEDI